MRRCRLLSAIDLLTFELCCHMIHPLPGLLSPAADVGPFMCFREHKASFHKSVIPVSGRASSLWLSGRTELLQQSLLVAE